MTQNNSALSEKEEKIIRDQIAKNRQVIDALIAKIDLLINREGHVRDSEIVLNMRTNLALLMEENDTFRKVYWRHLEAVETGADSGYADALRYMIIKIKSRRKAASNSLLADYEIGTLKKSK